MCTGTPIAQGTRPVPGAVSWLHSTPFTPACPPPTSCPCGLALRPLWQARQRPRDAHRRWTTPMV